MRDPGVEAPLEIDEQALAWAAGYITCCDEIFQHIKEMLAPLPDTSPQGTSQSFRKALADRMGLSGEARRKYGIK